MARLDEDATADKLLRFAIGAFIGAGTACGTALKWDVHDGRDLAALAVICCAGMGGLCVIFGNKFIEGLLGVRKE